MPRNRKSAPSAAALTRALARDIVAKSVPTFTDIVFSIDRAEAISRATDQYEAEQAKGNDSIKRGLEESEADVLRTLLAALPDTGLRQLLVRYDEGKNLRASLYADVAYQLGLQIGRAIPGVGQVAPFGRKA